ncbi:MAG: peptide ABC transporter substrate-binding protein [Patescibacteria group bacterium]|jgi:peptide/nickel transport system substrate-binding protein|nr:peptide ABC transporter substrate-binding protein [Patescibacteria group bacterium]
MKIKRFGIKSRLILKKFVLDIKRSHLKDLRNRILVYFKKLPDVVHLRNLILFSAILSFIIMVMFFQRFSALHDYYQVKSPDYGGIYTEGVVGDIEKINPLFVKNYAEASANRLVFSGLTRVMPDNKIIPDLAEKWDIKDNGKTYVFTLRKNAKWHDNQALTVDDVIFTINLIQNPDTRTSQSAVWQNIKAEKIDNQKLKITLPNVYSNFLEVASQPILPEHLLKETDPSSIKISEFNLKPIGSGPYKFVRFDQAGNEVKIIFKANENFQPHKPYIDQVNLRLYDNFNNLYNGILRKQVNSVTQIPSNKASEIRKIGSMKLYDFYLPRYKLIDLNLKNSLLAQKEIRKAISQAINRTDVIDKVLNGQAMPAYAPILPGQEGYNPALNKNSYNLASANDVLEKLGWIKEKDGIRVKDGKRLSLRFVAANETENRNVMEVVKKQLNSIGVEVNTSLVESDLLQAEYIRPRNFDLILFGQNTGSESDLYSFWHSSQINDPGLNLSGFNDRRVDKLIELGRKSNNTKIKNDKYNQAQEIIVEETPAIYLYNPVYTMAVTGNIKNFFQGKIFDPVDHLNNIFDWYINEKAKL